MGSPPRVRGKECLLGSAPNPFGITPAYAGKRKSQQDVTWHTGDHPRVCGEKPDCKAKRNPKKGSPPACAGKSSHQHGAGRWRRDHPRVCGEKPRRLLLRCSLVGSPPRVRGKARAHKQTRTIRRITPACAGKRYCYGLSKVVDRDHPRVCGEKLKSFANAVELEGSPPRVRGKVAW